MILTFGRERRIDEERYGKRIQLTRTLPDDLRDQINPLTGDLIIRKKDADGNDLPRDIVGTIERKATEALEMTEALQRQVLTADQIKFITARLQSLDVPQDYRELGIGRYINKKTLKLNMGVILMYLLNNTPPGLTKMHPVRVKGANLIKVNRLLPDYPIGHLLDLKKRMFVSKGDVLLPDHLKSRRKNEEKKEEF